MIECIFTIDYEIYGNGVGSLKELVYEPVRKLKGIFDRFGEKMVVFVEVAELKKIEVLRTDPFIGDVKEQIQELHEQGHEIGLHLHPQWCNARFEEGFWILDYSEYNICTLEKKRIKEIIENGIGYLRDILRIPDFTPISFRAGNWLLQPTGTVATVLYEQGIRVDSSVFRGGLRHQHKLDYRMAIRNGAYWKFKDCVDIPDVEGTLLELPIHTQMVPFWKMLNLKRVSKQHIGIGAGQSSTRKLIRLLDFLRFWHPLKFDFCCMTIDELKCMVDKVIQDDQKNPFSFRPIVAIGHTKELVDLETVESLLAYLGRKNITVSTFQKVYHRCR